jgi:hypothetical protein
MMRCNESEPRIGAISACLLQAASRLRSVPQCLHLVAAAFRSSDRHAGQVWSEVGRRTLPTQSGHDKLIGHNDHEIYDRHKG